MSIICKTFLVQLGEDSTNADGRCPKVRPPTVTCIYRSNICTDIADWFESDFGALQLLPVDHALEIAIYKCTFDTKTYYASQGQTGFYPEVPIIFEVKSSQEHYHIPLLLSPYGYSTYRGS